MPENSISGGGNLFFFENSSKPGSLVLPYP
jgi:hypothetical protein